MKALIIGATGATGREIVSQLLDNSDYHEVVAFTRQPIGLQHPKLTNHVVDFRQPETWAKWVQGDVAFSCLGTTLKVAGSQAAQFEIDHDFQLSFAKMAAKNGVKTLVLISAAGANERSKMFYTRIKGQLEQAVLGLSFERLVIVRPPILERQNSDRFSEKFAVKLFHFLNILGLLTSQKPMPTSVLARAMIRLANGNSGVHILDAKEIFQAA